MFFFFKQKTAYEMRISDWSSDVCSSDLADGDQGLEAGATGDLHVHGGGARAQLGAQHDLADQVEVPGVLDHGATGNHAELLTLERSEARRVGKEGVSTGRSRWSPYHYKKKTRKTYNRTNHNKTT